MATGDGDNSSGVTTVTTPTGGYVKGDVYVYNDKVIVARETKSAGEDCLVQFHGPVTATKEAGTGLSLSIGSDVYLNTSNNEFTATSTGNTAVHGFVYKDAAATDTTVRIWLGIASLPS